MWETPTEGWCRGRSPGMPSLTSPSACWTAACGRTQAASEFSRERGLIGDVWQGHRRPRGPGVHFIPGLLSRCQPSGCLSTEDRSPLPPMDSVPALCSTWGPTLPPDCLPASPRTGGEPVPQLNAPHAVPPLLPPGLRHPQEKGQRTCHPGWSQHGDLIQPWPQRTPPGQGSETLDVSSTAPEPSSGIFTKANTQTKTGRVDCVEGGEDRDPAHSVLLTSSSPGLKDGPRDPTGEHSLRGCG